MAEAFNVSQTYKLDLVPGSIQQAVRVSQDDVGSRVLVFEFHQRSDDVSVPTSGVVTMNGKKPDGNVFSYEMTRESENTYSIAVKEQMTAVAGAVLCEISIQNDGTKLGSANFTMIVEKSPMADGVVSDSDLEDIRVALGILGARTDIDEIINAKDIAKASADDAESAADRAETSANQAVSAANRAETYRDEARQYAEDTSANASFFEAFIDSEGYISWRYKGGE